MRPRRHWRLVRNMKALVSLSVLLCACFAIPQTQVSAPVMADPAAIQQQQRAAAARSMGYPTQHTAAELDALIGEQTRSYRATGRRGEGHLEAPAPFTIDGTRGTCYKVVMRLADGAAWGPGADAGLRFDFHSPTGDGSGGPGVRGPGAVVSVGCAEADGVIALNMAPMMGHDPIGHGAFALELWSHRMTKQEAAAREADKQQQIREQREFAAAEAQKKHDREISGCSKCDGRYQGCIGAGRDESTCRSAYSSCAFEEVGADYLSACPHAR